MSGTCDEVFTVASSSWSSSALSKTTQRHTRRPGRHRHGHRHAEDQRRLAHQRRLAKRETPVSRDIVQKVGIFGGIVEELSHDYSELRLCNGTHLVFDILRTVLQQHMLIHDASEARLHWYEKHVDQDADCELVRLRRQMGQQIQHLESLASLLDKLRGSPSFAGDVRYHLEALRDSIAQLSRRVGEGRELCEALRDEVKAEKEAKGAQANFNLSLIVTLVLPFQLLTGVYGMNFQDEAGQGMVPLMGHLTDTNSYCLFWGLGCVLTTTMYLWFRHTGVL